MSHDFRETLTDAKYHGFVSIKLLASGLRMVIENARCLVDDCKILAKEGRYARAFSLSITALEEIGKISVLFKMANLTPRTQRFWRQFWKEFRNHNRKSTLGLVTSVIDETQGNIPALLVYTIKQSLAADAVETFRQTGLYVDFNSEKKVWTDPNQVPREIAEGAIVLASNALERQLRIQNLGIYEVGVLKLKQKMYGDIQEELDPAGLSPEKVDAVIEKVKDIHRAFFKQLCDLGIDISESDLSI